MSMNEVDMTAKELLSVRSEIEKLQELAEALTDQLKAVMIDQGTETIRGDGWHASWKNVTSSRFDSKAFRAEHADLFTAFSKPVTTCRFVIGA